MLVFRIILGIVCILATFVARSIYQRAYEKSKSKCAAVFCRIFGTIAAITGLIFVVWSISKFVIEFSFLNWLIPSLFSIFEVIAISGDTELGDGCAEIAMTIGIIAAIINGVIWVMNYESPYVDCKDEHVEVVETIEIKSVEDSTVVNGSVSGGGFLVWHHVSGSINETPVYRYYYQLPDGGMKIGEIPANSTTIYYIEDGKEPCIEVVKSKSCGGYNPKTGDHRLQYTNTTYKLYVPEGSVLEDFQFDGN